MGKRTRKEGETSDKSTNFRWSIPMDCLFLEILADETTKGNKPSSSFKPTSFVRVAQAINEKFGCECSPLHVENHLRTEADMKHNIIPSGQKRICSADSMELLQMVSSFLESYLVVFHRATYLELHGNNKSVILLDMLYYNLSGTLFPAITQLRTIVNLSLAGNGFSGAFTPEIHKLPRLQFLNISNNQFNGSLNWVSQLKELVLLDAYNNEFSGSLLLGGTQILTLKHLDFDILYYSRLHLIFEQKCPTNEKYLNKKIDMYEEMALVAGKAIATGDDNEVVAKGKDGSSTATSSCGRQHRKRKREDEDTRYDKLVGEIGQVALAIKQLTKNELVISDLYDEVMKTKGFDETFLATVFDCLVENEKQAKAFMVKSDNLRKIWIANFMAKL
ncbi:hypothetical protein RJ640_002081 [Escallonia rubra]|uniref:Myb/SANT-like domain-containing protein n=1 Tax=Escallonia rubra TaxID=112253 RepID=A0AA88UP84_9ASTE|nr:hypothetical protein RJ640_002081 [Escallonia rubra]